jgi:N-acetylglucosaminyl-diphospho-decaprenol L-rhamnosyltransferase
MTRSKFDVAIVIVTYNSEEEITACLESVYQTRDGVSLQVVIVDNASSDGTVALVRERFPEVELLIPGKNLGFAAGVNFGVRHTDADFVLLLNPDTVLRPNAIRIVHDFALAHPQYGLYGGRTLKTDGRLEPLSCLGVPTLWSTFLFATGLSTIAPRSRWFNPESLGGWQRDTVREVGVITGCFLLVTSRIWNELGGFDERYFMYGEDVDLAIRARKAGYRPVICPDAELIHELGKSSESPAHKMLLLYRGKASLMLTHWKGLRLRAGLFLLAAGTGVRAVLGKLLSGGSGPDKGERWKVVWKNRREWLQGYSVVSNPSRANQ